ncbi:Clc protein-like family-containing protein [Strongyloides ratti]|uniref:Clc protein-like family-containing protein n=1 Tax=Strongyloides ratti TaxID=34506 RepID=A0A090KW98_STRRB|nr:Clc protein-like family-containing protein [Strongyloides ratti]CEF60141.1 Clc protein-like family-containing protein [Strongyloides ratti]
MVRRRIPLSIYFIVEIFAFIISLIALISPSWQYVYLEGGRTEHHHGLWLDCKRDYSNDYGRTKEYYESLYRLADRGSPFDSFYLPQFMCVYKFDYYIDPEDLYEHNYDENKLQDDANQHLLLAWKVVSLSAFLLSILSSGGALLIGICAFCHRTLTCASTVLVSISAFFAIIGNLIFYIWANYQDNNVIKEEDDIYEQFIGWAFYASVIGTILHIFASALGCLTTSFSFNNAKIVKIDVENCEDPLITISSQPSLNKEKNFKRTFSAVYKVDSSALRKFERDCARSMRNKEIKMAQMMKNQQTINHFIPYNPINPENLMANNYITSFKRANSVPNFKRYNNTLMSSNSIINNPSVATEPILYKSHQQLPSFQRRPSTTSLRKHFDQTSSKNFLNKSVSFTNLDKSHEQIKRKSYISEINDSDTIYEYVPLQNKQKIITTIKKQRPINWNFSDKDNTDDIYSSIYAQEPFSSLSNDEKIENEYLKPNESLSVQRTTFGNECTVTSILKKEIPQKEKNIKKGQQITEFEVEKDYHSSKNLNDNSLKQNTIKLPNPPLLTSSKMSDNCMSENINNQQTKSILKVNSQKHILPSNISSTSKQLSSSSESNNSKQFHSNNTSNILPTINNKVKITNDPISPKIGQRFYKKRSSSRGHRSIPNSVITNDVQKQSSEECESECDRSIGSFTYINNDHILPEKPLTNKFTTEHNTPNETVV